MGSAFPRWWTWRQTSWTSCSTSRNCSEPSNIRRRRAPRSEERAQSLSFYVSVWPWEKTRIDEGRTWDPSEHRIGDTDNAACEPKETPTTGYAHVTGGVDMN